MRRTALAFLLLATPVACSYLYETSIVLPQDPLTITSFSPEQSFRLRLCWSGAGQPDEATISVRASASVGVIMSFDDDEQGFGDATVGAVMPEPHLAPFQYWASDELEACELGTVVRFRLEDPNVDAVLDWEVAGSVSSTDDDAVEELELELFVEPL